MDNALLAVRGINHKYIVVEEIRYRKASTITLQQVKEPSLSFEKFNEMMERERAMEAETDKFIQDSVMFEKAELFRFLLMIWKQI